MDGSFLRFISFVLTSLRCPRLTVAFGVVALVCVSQPASAQVVESVGSRSLGLAGAFVAVADDATAAYWNPAGLTMGAFLSVIVDYGRQETTLDPDTVRGDGSVQTSTFVGLSTDSLALTYYRLGVNQVESAPPGASSSPPSAALGVEDPMTEAHRLASWTLHNLALTGAQLIAPGVSVGSTIRYVRAAYGTGLATPGLSTPAWIDESSDLPTRGQNALDWDLGIKAGSSRLHVGFVARNLLQPTLNAFDGSQLRLDRQFRAGVAVRPAERLLVSLDVDLNRQIVVGRERRNLAVGAEQRFGEWLALRGGFRVDLEEDGARPLGTIGLSVALTTGLFVDGHVLRGLDESARGWSIAGRFGF